MFFNAFYSYVVVSYVFVIKTSLVNFERTKQNETPPEKKMLVDLDVFNVIQINDCDC